MNEKQTPFVSVIVPVYKTEPYLAKCVDSILTQTHRNLEVILVDDGSPDRCGELCDAFAERDSRVKVIHKENGGPSSARNAALDICTGDYIAFVDSDDWIRPEMMRQMVAACAEHQADMAICGVAFDAGYRIIEYPMSKPRQVLSGKELLQAYCCGTEIRSIVWNKLYGRGLFSGLRFPEGKIYEDAFVMPRLLGQCQRGVLVQPCFYVQQLRPGSITRSGFSEKRLDMLDVAEETISYYQENCPELLHLAAFDKANAMAGAMREIVESFQYSRRKGFYHQLEARLPEVYAQARLLVPEAGEAHADTLLAMRHPKRFRLGCLWSGVKERVKGKIKRGIYLLRKAAGKR